MSRNPLANDEYSEHQPYALLRLSLTGLLPATQQLVVNPRARTAILLEQAASGEAIILTEQQFSPNGMRVLIPLLRAYPNYCPYEALLAALFSLTVDEARHQLREIKEVALRSVRRAVGSLATRLRAFGLRVQSVRCTINSCACPTVEAFAMQPGWSHPFCIPSGSRRSRHWYCSPGASPGRRRLGKWRSLCRCGKAWLCPCAVCARCCVATPAWRIRRYA